MNPVKGPWRPVSFSEGKALWRHGMASTTFVVMRRKTGSWNDSLWLKGGKVIEFPSFDAAAAVASRLNAETQSVKGQSIYWVVPSWVVPVWMSDLVEKEGE